MKRITLILACALSCFLLAGCGEDPAGNNGDQTADAGDTSDATDTGAPDVADSTDDTGDSGYVGTECVDCHDEVTCQDGTARWTKGGGGCFPANDVPNCSELSSGLSETYECEKGCRADEDYSGIFDQTELENACEENRPKSTGDACQDDTDCTPTADGQPALECDTNAGECVEASS